MLNAKLSRLIEFLIAKATSSAEKDFLTELGEASSEDEIPAIPDKLDDEDQS